jgi:hypothetical protein
VNSQAAICPEIGHTCAWLPSSSAAHREEEEEEEEDTGLKQLI